MEDLTFQYANICRSVDIDIYVVSEIDATSAERLCPDGFTRTLLCGSTHVLVAYNDMMCYLP